MRSTLSMLLLIQFYIVGISAQSLTNLQDTIISFGHNYKFHNALETPDGKIFAVGQTYGVDVDGVLLLYDPLLNKVQRLEIKGDEGEDVLTDHTMLCDGTFLICGYRKFVGEKLRKAWIVRTDENGREIKGEFLHIPSYKENAIYQIESTATGDIVLAGEVNAQLGRVWISLFSGRECKSEFYLGNGELGPVKCMVGLPNGDLVLTGNLNGAKKSKEGDVWVLIIDSQGKEIKRTILNEKSWREPEQLIIDSDGNIYIAGKVRRDGKNGWDYWLTRLTPSLEPVYSKTYGGIKDDQIFSLTLLNNRYLALAGATHEHSTMALESQAVIIFADLDGNRIQTWYAGNDYDDEWYQILSFHDGSIIALGQQGARKEAKTIWLSRFAPLISTQTINTSKTTVDHLANDFKVEKAIYKDYDGNSILSSGERGWIEITLINNSTIGSHFEILSQLRDPNLGVNLIYGEKTYKIPKPKDTKTLIEIHLEGKANISRGTQLIDIKITNGAFNKSVSYTIKTNNLKNNKYTTEIIPEVKTDKSGRGVSVHQNYLLQLKSKTPKIISDKNIHILHNGVVIQSPKGEDAPANFSCDLIGTNYVMQYEKWVRLKSGTNSFEAFIIDDEGDTIAYMETIEIVLVNEKIPNLHLVAIGPPHNNLSTDKDAADFIEYFKNQSGEIFGSIKDQLYNTDRNTSYFGIIKIFRDLLNKFNPSQQGSDNIKPGDVIIVYISTHGYTSPDSIFYIAPMDVDWSEKKPLVNYKTEILAPLQELADSCVVIVFIDACHSGGAKSGDIDDSQILEKIWEDMRQQAPGIITIASSKAEQYSQDLPDKKQGAFTYAVFEAFRDVIIKDDEGNLIHADQNGDNFLNLLELFNFLKIRVPMLTRQTPLGIQEPVIPKMQVSPDKIYIYKIKNQ